jgi:hypothetical protein
MPKIFGFMKTDLNSKSQARHNMAKLTVYSVKGFRDFFTHFNKAQMDGEQFSARKPITAEVIPVAEGTVSEQTLSISRML